jgi:hypothetical protein
MPVVVIVKEELFDGFLIKYDNFDELDFGFPVTVVEFE